MDKRGCKFLPEQYNSSNYRLRFLLLTGVWTVLPVKFDPVFNRYKQDLDRHSPGSTMPCNNGADDNQCGTNPTPPSSNCNTLLGHGKVSDVELASNYCSDEDSWTKNCGDGDQEEESGDAFGEIEPQMFPCRVLSMFHGRVTALQVKFS